MLTQAVSYTSIYCPTVILSHQQIPESKGVYIKFTKSKDSSSTNNIVIKISDFSRVNSTKNVRESSREFTKLVEQAPWVVKFLQSASTLDNVKTLLPYYVEINKLIAHRDFNLCNEFLRQVRVDELSNVLLVGLLRLTYSRREQLPYWKILLSSSEKELNKRKQDGRVLQSSHVLLKGLS